MHFNNLSVVEFNNIIKNIFDSEEMLFNCAVVGEISSFKITNNIAYFTIKDEYAVLNCVLFNADKEYKVGEKVKVVGRPNFYVKGGKFSFNASFLISFGEGEIFRRFNELKEQLKLEGFFLNKKELPEDVKNIGVITSSTGAVIKDIISVTKRRNPNINLYVYPVKVQGNNSENEIVNGINFFNNFNVDILIVARGGGSNEDLSAFNTEKVARACFVCQKPIISAVGHETDYTLIDLVADIRASTPSVAAEIAVKESKNKLQELKLLYKEISRLVNNNLSLLKERVEELNENINSLMGSKLIKKQIELNKIKADLKYAINTNVNKIEHLYESVKNKIEYLNPEIIYQKGFVKLIKKDKKITSIKDICVNDELDLILLDGKIKTKVLKVE
ncbi:MAG: exodeoxyribonuclease VII large subunit [Clostridiales bacterium]|nr:exodeoxyribonuclease VII large subunit [Clostridiales bacterium]